MPELELRQLLAAAPVGVLARVQVVGLQQEPEQLIELVLGWEQDQDP